MRNGEDGLSRIMRICVMDASEVDGSMWVTGGGAWEMEMKWRRK